MKKQLFILSLIFPFLSFAQHKIQSDTIITNVYLLPDYLKEHYQPNQDSVNNNCLRLCVFIKFIINAQGKIDSVNFTNGTPGFMTAGLQKSIVTVNKFLKLNSMQPLKDKTFIAPIIIDNNQGCGHEYGAWNFPTEKKLTPQLKKLYEQRLAKFEQTVSSVLEITNFNDKSYDAISCILLRPVYISGVRY